MAQGINMTTELQTDASLNKTSTNTNDSNVDHIADDTSVDKVSDDTSIDDAIYDIIANDIDAGVNADSDSKDGVENDVDADVAEKAIAEAIDIGNILKEKRLELGFDERHAATELKLPIDQVRALESNDFSHFRSVTFARGFLKSYCRLLELDHVVMIAAFDNKRASVETTIKPVDKVHRQTHLGDPIVIFISVVIVAVLIFLVFWWPTDSTTNVASDGQQEALIVETIEKVEAPTLVAPTANVSNENEQNTESTVVDSTPINTASAAVEEETPIAEVAKQEVAKPVAPKPVAPKVEVAKPAVVKAPEISNDVVTGLSAETVAILKEAGVSPDEVVRATQVVPTVETPTVVTQLDDIEIAFGEDCWAEIRDASGTILFSGVQSAGSTLLLTGDAPYRVVLGYAKGVSSLKYKGELFDFSPFTRKDLARFELK